MVNPALLFTQKHSAYRESCKKRKDILICPYEDF